MALQYRLSGGANNSAPNGSLGGIMSNTQITTDVLENLFDNITRVEALTGRTEFRCIYVYNTGGGHISGVVLELTTNPAVTMLSIGLDPINKGNGSTFGVATSIATEDTVPSGVKFFSEVNTDDQQYDTVRLPIGLLKNGEAVAVWFKRKTQQGAQQTLTASLVATHDAVTLPGETFDDGGAIGELIDAVKQTTGTYLIDTARIELSDMGSP